MTESKSNEPFALLRHRSRNIWTIVASNLSATKRSLTVLAFVLSAPALSAAASTSKTPLPLVGKPTCRHLDELGIYGLEWGLCKNPELKQLTRTVERKQRALLHSLDRFAGDALVADWLQFINEFRTQVGSKWFEDHVSDDVRSALKGRIQFLDQIDTTPRTNIIGTWKNSRAQLQITHNKVRGIDVQADDFTSCRAEFRGHAKKANGVTVLLNGTEVPVELFVSGNALRLSLNPDAYGMRYGCDASRLVGYYLPITPVPSEEK